MILVVDSNILFAALLRNSTVRALLIDSPHMLFAPEFIVQEIFTHEQEIVVRAGYSLREFRQLFGLVTRSLHIITKDKYMHCLAEADDLLGHVDKGDVPFLALALSFRCDAIWTENMKHFRVQTKIKCINTSSLLRI